MIARRIGTVLAARPAHAGLTDLSVDIDGIPAAAISYDALVGPVSAGDQVLLNTTAVSLGLGTGGVHIVIAVLPGRSSVDAVTGHAMKLRYTPMQTSVVAVEETHATLIDAVEGLDGMPVIVAGLHSAVAPAAIGARTGAPSARIAYVMTDAAALVMAFSRTVPALRGAGLLDATITCGQATGGEYEAVTLHGALAAAKSVLDADIVIVAMGPGNLGTGTRWGFALIETAGIIDTAVAMGARAIVVPRLSFADERKRHRGVSHHTTTALGLAHARAQVALPPLAPDRAERVRAQLVTVTEHHDLIEVALDETEEALRSSPLSLSSMGRTYDEDPDCFRAAAAAGVLAARSL